MRLRVERGEAVLLTRRGLDWSGEFAEIAASGAVLPDGTIDGEVVALDGRNWWRRSTVPASPRTA